MLGIGRDGEQGFRYGLEKDAIDLARILECQSADLRRQRKHNVEIRGRQEFSFPLGQPLGARCCLTLWAVSVAARIIGDDAMPAMVAPVHMAAEGGRAAIANRHERFSLLRT